MCRAAFLSCKIYEPYWNDWQFEGTGMWKWIFSRCVEPRAGPGKCLVWIMTSVLLISPGPVHGTSFATMLCCIELPRTQRLFPTFPITAVQTLFENRNISLDTARLLKRKSYLLPFIFFVTGIFQVASLFSFSWIVKFHLTLWTGNIARNSGRMTFLANAACD